MYYRCDIYYLLSYQGARLATDTTYKHSMFLCLHKICHNRASFSSATFILNTVFELKILQLRVGNGMKQHTAVLL